MLEVRLIGRFEIRIDGELVALSTRAAQSLFAFLILSGGTPHRRKKLAGLFWPDASEQKARTYLRQELWRIRKALSTKTNIEYLSADDIAISFQPKAEKWLDVDVLQNVDDHAPISDLMQALSVYTGELLPGFYEDWVLEEREHLHSIFEKRIVWLLEALEEKKRWQEVLDWGERWISASQPSEVAYQYLMTAYDALGDRAKVVSTYERCVAALRKLDLEPSETTRSLLYKRRSKLNLPIPLTSFIGRESELKEIAELLWKFRLVTLTGAGGVGKTCLAVQVAGDLLDQFPDGGWFLDLAPLTDPTLVPNTLANLLGLQESGETPLTITDLLVNYFRTRTALIIFDNCEHLVDACARLVHILLTSSEHLSILATSREALRVAGEIPHRVPSLETPRLDMKLTLQDLVKNESVRLFAERASADLPGFTLNDRNTFPIAQICRRLDGIPLAIELAAARARILSIEQILHRLDDRFNLLTGGLRSALPRQQTLRATIEWSYDLLSEKEKILFRRMAVFGGGCSLEDAEEVCSGDGLSQVEVLDLITQLVNKSLVVVESSGELAEGLHRYRRLEIIREFAHEKLRQANEDNRMMDRHLKYFLRKVEELEPRLVSPDQAIWMDYLDSVLDDIRLALEWAISNQNGEEALRLFGSLGWYWFIRCRFREGEEWFRRLQPFVTVVSPRIQAKVLTSASWLYYTKDDFKQTLLLHKQCRDICCELGDEKEMSTSLQFMGVMEFTLGNFGEARELFNECLEICHKVNNKAAMPRALMHLGHFAQMEKDYAAAKRYYEESLSVSREVGEGHLLMMVLGTMGAFSLEHKNFKQARDYYAEALDIGIRLKNKRTIAQEVLIFTQLLNLQGRYQESARLQGFAECLFTESEVLTESHLAAIRETASIPKEQLGEQSYRREFNKGRPLDLNQAVEIILRT